MNCPHCGKAVQPEVVPTVATPAMIEAVSTILEPYTAKLVWIRMLEAARSPLGEPK